MHTRSSIKRYRLAAGSTSLLLALSGLLAGCAGSSDAGGEEQTPGEVLAAAKANLDQTSGVHLTLATEELPPGVSGVLGADGTGVHPPAFEGKLTVLASGVSVDVGVVAVDDTVYAKLPFTTRFTQVDPADYGAPDPAVLMAREGGLSSLLTAAEQVARKEQRRNGEQVVTVYTGVVPGTDIARIIPSADQDAGFKASFSVTDDDLLRQAVLTGPFYPGGDQVSYTIGFDEYGTTQDITAP